MPNPTPQPKCFGTCCNSIAYPHALCSDLGYSCECQCHQVPPKEKKEVCKHGTCDPFFYKGKKEWCKNCDECIPTPEALSEWEKEFGFNYERLLKLYRKAYPNEKGNVPDEAAYDYFCELKNFIARTAEAARKEERKRLIAELSQIDK